MKFKTLLLTAVFAFNATLLNAEAIILTIDVAKVFEGYYRAIQAQDKFATSFDSAQEEIRQLVDEGRQLLETLQEEYGKANNPALTEEAKNRHSAKAKELENQIRRKENELNNFRQQTNQSLAARHDSILELHLGEVKDAVKEVAEIRNADFVLNMSGPSVVYAKSGADITYEVLQRLNADAPSSSK